jgi:hypothetical protein
LIVPSSHITLQHGIMHPPLFNIWRRDTAPTADAPPSHPTSDLPRAAPSHFTRPPRPRIQSLRDISLLREYQAKYLGDPDFDAHAALLGESFYDSLSSPLASNDAVVATSIIHNILPGQVTWRTTLPSKHALRRSCFGKPDLLHSFYVKPGLECTVYHVLCSGYTDLTSLIQLLDTHSLFAHLASAIVHCRFYDFRLIRTCDTNWGSQTAISPIKMSAMMACLIHYNLDTSLLMRYLGNNYTGAYQQDQDVATILRGYRTPERLLSNYIRVMTTGCPAKFTADTTRANAGEC